MPKYLTKYQQKIRDNYLRIIWANERGNLTMEEIAQIFKMDIGHVYRIISGTRYYEKRYNK